MGNRGNRPWKVCAHGGEVEREAGRALWKVRPLGVAMLDNPSPLAEYRYHPGLPGVARAI